MPGSMLASSDASMLPIFSFAFVFQGLLILDIIITTVLVLPLYLPVDSRVINRGWNLVPDRETQILFLIIQ